MSKMRGEAPLAVEHDAAQVEHMLGAASAPLHLWTIEPHTVEQSRQYVTIDVVPGIADVVTNDDGLRRC